MPPPDRTSAWRALQQALLQGRPWIDRVVVLTYAVLTGLVVVGFTLLTELATTTHLQLRGMGWFGAGLALQANAEAHLRSRLRLAQLFRPEWLEASVAIAGRCAFSLGELKYEYPREIVPEGHTPTTWLRALTEAGVKRRYPAGEPASVRAGIEHELALIGQLKFEPYFLTVADIVQWARSQGILCQGRGSAANSEVC